MIKASRPLTKVHLDTEELRIAYFKLYKKLNKLRNQHRPWRNSRELVGLTEDDKRVDEEIKFYLQEYTLQLMEMLWKETAMSADDRLRMHDEGLTARDMVLAATEDFVEEFDLELNEQVREAYKEWEDHIVEVAQLRKNGPQTVKKMFEDSRDQVLQHIDSEIAQLSQEQVDGKDNIDSQSTETGNHKAFWDDIRTLYRDSMEELASTADSLPQTRRRVRNLHNLTAYLEQE